MSSRSSQETLKLADQLLASGGVDKARSMIFDLLEQEPSNAEAWFLASYTTDNPQEQINAVKQSLAINAENQQAKKRLAEIYRANPALKPKPSTLVSCLSLIFVFSCIGLVIQGMGKQSETVNIPTPTITLTASQTYTPRPTLTPSSTSTPRPTSTRTITLTPSLTLTQSLTPTPSVTSTPTLTLTITLTPSPTLTQSLTPTQTPTLTLIPTLTLTPSLTLTASLTSTETFTPSPTFTPTQTPTLSNTQRAQAIFDGRTATANSRNQTATDVQSTKDSNNTAIADYRLATLADQYMSGTATADARLAARAVQDGYRTSTVEAIAATKEFIAGYKSISIDELATYANNHIGEQVYVRGRVFNIIDTQNLQVMVNGNPIYVQLADTKFLNSIYKNDYVTVYGTVNGMIQGQNAFGGNISQAELSDATVVK